MGFLSLELPIDASAFNVTNGSGFADTPVGYFEVPRGQLGLMLFCATAAIATFTVVGYCNMLAASQKMDHRQSGALPLALAATLALLLLSVPVSNMLWIGGYDGFSDLLGLIQLVLLLNAVWLAASIAWQACDEPEPDSGLRCKPSPENQGKEYPFEYVGCMVCKKPLTKAHFFSCATCTERKIDCTVSYELCSKCVVDHNPLHEVLRWEQNTCIGMVDYEEDDGGSLSDS